MDVKREQVIQRTDPAEHPGGTPLEGGPDHDFGTDMVPKERYISEEFMQQEWDRIWTKTWLLGCREDEIPEPGDYVATNIGKESVLLVRQRDASIKAFANVCMHRGNRLADEGRGSVNRFVCGYHGWAYGIEGYFDDIPDLATFPQGAPPCGGLAELPCETWVSFVWFSLDPEVEPFADYMGDMIGHFEPYHFERMAMTRWVTAEWNCNWKAGVDAFAEAYHTAQTHPQLLWYLDDLDIQFDMYDKHSRYLIAFGVLSPRIESAPEIPPPLKALLTKAGLDPASYEGSVNGIRRAVQERMRSHQDEMGKDYSELHDDQLTDDYNYLIFPNVTFNTHADDLMLFRHRPHPTDPNKMLFDVWMFDLIPEGEEWPELPRYDFRPEGSKRSLGQVIDQDAANLATVQQGMQSASYPGLWLSDQEVRLRHFHQTITDHVESK